MSTGASWIAQRIWGGEEGPGCGVLACGRRTPAAHAVQAVQARELERARAAASRLPPLPRRPLCSALQQPPPHLHCTCPALLPISPRCVFYYSGAASRAGLSYSGAILASKDGQWPASEVGAPRQLAAVAVRAPGRRSVQQAARWLGACRVWAILTRCRPVPCHR